MNPGNHSSELALQNVVGATHAGRGTEFIFPPPRPIAANRVLTQRLLLALTVAMVFLCLWTCWSFFRNWENYSTRLLLATSGLLGLCLAAMGASGGALLRSRQTAAENQRLAELNARLLKERDLLRTIIDALPDYIYAKDRQGHFVLNNPAHARDLGASSAQEMMGKTDFDFFPRELAEQFFADEQKIIATGESVINQEQYKRRPGSTSAEKIWSLSSKVMWRDRDGEILGTVGITRDIHK